MADPTYPARPLDNEASVFFACGSVRQENASASRFIASVT